jgi:hypothetical protein
VALGILEDQSTPTSDKLLVKLDADGGLVFARLIQGLPAFSRLHVIEAAGDIVVCSARPQTAGTTGGTFVFRFDASGGLRWQVELPALVDPGGLVPLADGSIAVVARFAGPAIVVLDPAGSVVAANGLQAQLPAGDVLPFRLTSLALTSDQGFVLAGSVADSETTLAVRLGADGQGLWARAVDIEARFGSISRISMIEMVLSTTTTYLLSVGDARNAERGIEGVAFVRFDEHGDVGRDGCGLVSPVVVGATNMSVQAQTASLLVSDQQPEVNAVTSTVTDLPIANDRVCVHERQIRIDPPPFIEPPLTICFDEQDPPVPGPRPSPDPGPGPRPLPPDGVLPLKRSCNDDPACPRCLQRLEDDRYVQNPAWRADLYRAFRPFLRSPESKVPVKAADRLSSALSKVPDGRFFGDELRGTLGRRLERWKAARATTSGYVPRASELGVHLARAANLVDLDLLLPDGIDLTGDADGSVGVGRLLRVWVGSDREAPLRVAARVVTDAPGLLPPQMVPGWPSLLWQIETPGDRLDFFIRLSYAALRFAGPESALRLVQWRERGIRDITVHVDRRNRTVVGHARGSGVFTVLQRLASR